MIQEDRREGGFIYTRRGKGRNLVCFR